VVVGCYDIVLLLLVVVDFMLYVYLVVDVCSVYEGCLVFGCKGGGMRVGDCFLF